MPTMACNTNVRNTYNYLHFACLIWNRDCRTEDESQCDLVHAEREIFEFMNEKYGKIKPEKGMMIAFPADLDWVHRVNTVTKGDSYTMASWYTDG